MANEQVIFIVREGEFDEERSVAAYLDGALADRHAEEVDGWVDSVMLLATLPVVITDPAEIAKRATKRHAEKRRWEEYYKSAAEAAKARANIRPNPPHMRLCCCGSHSHTLSFLNDHGYCSYCGGFEPKVFIEHMGVERAEEQIGDLEKWRRDRMRSIIAALIPA